MHQSAARHKTIDNVANELEQILSDLKKVQPELTLQVDQLAVKNAVLDLTKCQEMCRIVAAHQIGSRLEEDMGLSGIDPRDPSRRPK